MEMEILNKLFLELSQIVPETTRTANELALMVKLDKTQRMVIEANNELISTRKSLFDTRRIIAECESLLGLDETGYADLTEAVKANVELIQTCNWLGLLTNVKKVDVHEETVKGLEGELVNTIGEKPMGTESTVPPICAHYFQLLEGKKGPNGEDVVICRKCGTQKFSAPPQKENIKGDDKQLLMEG